MGAGGGVGVLQAIKRSVLRLSAFVAVGAVAAVQVPAADERAGPQRPQQGQLLFNWRLFGMQAQAVGNGGHWLGVQRAGLAPAAGRVRALKSQHRALPAQSRHQAQAGPVAARRPADDRCA